MALLQGDCLTVLPGLAAGSINCCVTSPPYYGLRDYGVEGQIGLESTPEAYVEKLVAVFREVWRVLKDDGTVWLNLGDSYAGSGKGGNPKDSPFQKQRTNAGSLTVIERSKHKVKQLDGLKPKDLIGIPWRVAFALQADGWYLRQDIIWSKPNPMPESVKDRCTKSHEYIFLLSKSRKYYFDQDAIKEPVAQATVERSSYQYNMAFRGQFKGSPKDKRHQEGKYIAAVLGWKEPVAKSTIGRGPVDFGGKKGREYTPKKGDPNYRGGKEQWGRTFDYRESCKTGRNRRSVWTVSTKPFKKAHFATFPPDLIEPCILAGCPRGGTVLDPFSGAGTTGVVCLAHARNYIGIELNKEYIAMSTRRLRATRD